MRDVSVPTYKQDYCYECQKSLGRNEMHPVTVEVSPLRSGASIGVRQNGRRRGGLLWSVNFGRKYYTKKTVWFCDECYQRRERAEAIKGGLALLAILIFVGIAYFGSGSQHAATDQTSPATSATPDVQSTTGLAPTNTGGITQDQAQSATGSSAALPPQATGNSAVASAVAQAGASVGSATNSTALTSQSGANAGPSRGVPTNAGAADVPQNGTGSDVGPSIETRGAIQYPIEALRSGQEGVVVLEVAVSASGGVENVTVVKSSGYRPLDAAAVQSVRRWQFSPGRQDGQPVAGDVRVPVKFSLSGMQ